MSDMPSFEAALAASLNRCEPDDVARSAADLIERQPAFGDVELWIVDYGVRRLEDAIEDRPSKSIAGSIEGRCFLSGEPEHCDGRAYVPLDRRGERLGVLSVACGAGALEELSSAAIVVAHALAAAAEHGDDIPARRGAARLTLPATIQYSLLPMQRFEGTWMEIGCAFEPAYDIGGDSYDYAVHESGAHVGLFDAVGHGLRAALIATTVMGAYRRSRLFSRSPEKIAAAIDAVVQDEFADGEFVTGLVAWIDRTGRRLEITNAGHLPPILVRDGQAHALVGSPNLPLGLGAPNGVVTADVEPGDLLIAYTDGVVQARDPEDAMLGEEVIADLASNHRDAPPWRLCSAVLDAVDAHVRRPLADDATLLALRIGG